MTDPTLYDLPALYDRIVRVGPCESFYRDLASRTGGPILELACGTGRLTVPLAREDYEIVALDASSAMLHEAQLKARSLPVTFVHADMRDFDLRRRFPLIMLSCNSLAHLTTQDDLRAALESVRRHLAGDGLFAFDIVNPDLRVLAQSQSESVRLDLGPNPSSAMPVEEIASYDRVQQIRVARWRVLHQDTAAEIAPLNLRLFFPQEVPLLMETAGLQLIERYGDFARNPFSNDSLNQVCIARAASPG